MTCDYIQIKIKMPNLSQEHSASSKAPNKESKDMGVLCTFKMKIGGNINEPKTSYHIQIKIKMPNPSQEPSAPTKAQNQDLRMWMFFAPLISR